MPGPINGNSHDPEPVRRGRARAVARHVQLGLDAHRAAGLRRGVRGRRGSLPARDLGRAPADQVAPGRGAGRGSRVPARVHRRRPVRRFACRNRRDLRRLRGAHRAPAGDRGRNPAIPPVRDRPARQPDHRLGGRHRGARGRVRRPRRHAPGGPRPADQGEHRSPSRHPRSSPSRCSSRCGGGCSGPSTADSTAPATTASARWTPSPSACGTRWTSRPSGHRSRPRRAKRCGPPVRSSGCDRGRHDHDTPADPAAWRRRLPPSRSR